jgi:hypothetical protein
VAFSELRSELKILDFFIGLLVCVWNLDLILEWFQENNVPESMVSTANYTGDFLFPSFKPGKHTQFSCISHRQAQHVLAVFQLLCVSVDYIQHNLLLPVPFVESVNSR